MKGAVGAMSEAQAMFEEISKEDQQLMQPPEGFVYLGDDYRRGTIARRITEHFLLGNGGIGDLICYLRPLQWIAETQPQVHGVVWTFPFFLPVVESLFSKYGWEFKNVYDAVTEEGKSFLATQIVFAAYNPAFNAGGTHALDLGFLYYCNMHSPPDGYNNYPKLPLPDISNFNLPVGPFAILTGGATSPLRSLPPEVFNGIKDMLIRKGFVPVFIGKEEISDGYTVKFKGEYDYAGGINLIDKTTLLEAAAIIQEADVCLGLDNGLLHVAGCTTTPLVIGYNVISPDIRLPRRAEGLIATVTPDVSCSFCQSKMRHLNKDLQKMCMYNDLKCLSELTVNKWEAALNYVLGL